MTLVLDAGAFLAVERGDQWIAALAKRERLAGRSAVTSGGVVGQVWRGGAGKQALIARLLASVRVVPIDAALGREAGVLLARTGGSDVVDASLVCLARTGDDVVTSDPKDMQVLARAAGVKVDLVTV